MGKTTLGCDIVHLPRIEVIMNDSRMLEKIFHKTELEPFTCEHLGGVYTVKESVFKALQLPGNSWLDVEVVKEASGKPVVRLSSHLEKTVSSIECSISHDGDYAFGVVIVKSLQGTK